jgi:hypothetical protein
VIRGRLRGLVLAVVLGGLVLLSSRPAMAAGTELAKVEFDQSSSGPFYGAPWYGMMPTGLGYRALVQAQ